MRRLGLVLAGVFLLAGCAVGPAYRRPAVELPAQIRGAQGAPGAPATEAQAASLADQAWWDVFHDEALNALIREALRNSYDVRLAAARVEEARANAGITRAAAFPAVQAQVQAGGSRQARGSSGSFVDVNLGVSWELDLWGRIRHLNEAALASYLASEEARRGVLLSLVSDIATSYFQLRELDQQLEIARRTTGSFQEIFNLFNQRLQGGAASGLETASAEAALASTAANIPDLERRIAAQENALSFLAGRNPGPIERGAALDAQLLPPAVPSGLPSDLLERRPDLRAAEQELIAANAEVGVAMTDFFPRLSLTAALGGVAPGVAELFGKGRTWSLGPGILSPVFQGRRLENQRRAAVARWEQARARYEQSVANAFGEVSTALVDYQKLAEVERERARAVAADREAVRLANMRYVAGLSAYLEVLQAQQQLYPAENLLADARFERLAALARLYRSLGGGWNLSGTGFEGQAGAGEGAP